MHGFRLTPARLLVLFLTGALGLVLLFQLFPGSLVHDVLDPLTLWIGLPLAALVLGFILGGMGRAFARTLLRLFFGAEPGKFFLERESRSAKKARSHLAHAAGYRFDRNFPQTFTVAFKNYFRYETNIPAFQDQLCLSALAASDSPLYPRLRRMSTAVEVRANLALLALLYTVGRLVVALVGPAAGFTTGVIVELAAGAVLALSFSYSLLRVQAAWFHDLYLSFFLLAVEDDVDRPTVKLEQPRGEGSSRRRRGGRRRSSGGNQPGRQGQDGRRDQQKRSGQSGG